MSSQKQCHRYKSLREDAEYWHKMYEWSRHKPCKIRRKLYKQWKLNMPQKKEINE